MPRDTNTQNAKKKINNTRGDLGETLKSDENKTCITRKLDKMFFKWDDIIEKHSNKHNKFVLKKKFKTINEWPIDNNDDLLSMPIWNSMHRNQSTVHFSSTVSYINCHFVVVVVVFFIQ